MPEREKIIFLNHSRKERKGYRAFQKTRTVLFFYSFYRPGFYRLKDLKEKQKASCFPPRFVQFKNFLCQHVNQKICFPRFMFFGLNE